MDQPRRTIPVPDNWILCNVDGVTQYVRISHDEYRKWFISLTGEPPSLILEPYQPAAFHGETYKGTPQPHAPY